MIKYLKRYKELVIKLEKEKKILRKLHFIANQAQEHYQENQNNISYLSNGIRELEDSIKEIIYNKIYKVKQSTTIFSSILFAIILITISVASKFNFGIMFSSCLYSIIGCYFLNINMYTLLEKKYRKKNKKIITIQELINEMEIELNKYKEENINLIDNRRNAIINYNNQKHKILQIENIIRDVMVDYATPIFEKEINTIYKEENVLTRVKNQKLEKNNELNPKSWT